MKPWRLPKFGWVFALLTFAPIAAQAFDSGSTGADGAFSPAVSTTLQLPPNGVFNFTTVNIPTGVTVRFLRNASNSPVTMLASGNVTIAGTIDVSGGPGADTGTAGNGNVGDDSIPGKGGPGGFDGGRGGVNTNGANGGGGLGPGGGGAGTGSCQFGQVGLISGAGGGYGATATVAGANFCVGTAGTPYGSNTLLPLIGGSGGGGGMGGSSLGGGGGGGGGGALLVASSGIVNVTGSILANAGAGANIAGTNAGAGGGGGSGGAIRIVATTITGNGTLSANGGAGSVSSVTNGGTGAVGRIRLEAENITRTASSTPVFAFGTPGTVFVAGAPTLTISSIGGVAVPVSPTGVADVSLPANVSNPVTVAFATTNVPPGGTVKLTVTPATGSATSATSSTLAGTTASATANVLVTLPAGPSVLQAQLTYTVVGSLGEALRQYAGNERVERIQLSAALGGTSKVTLITVSGREFDAPPEALRVAALGD